MEKLRYYLKLKDGTCSRFVEDPQELIDAAEEQGILGDIFVFPFEPKLFTKMRVVLQVAEDNPPQQDAASEPEPKVSGNGTVRKKTRRTKRPPADDKGEGPAGIQHSEGQDSQS